MNEQYIEFSRESNVLTVAAIFGVSMQQARVLQTLMRDDLAPLGDLKRIVPQPHLSIHRLKLTLGSNLELHNCRGIGYVVSAVSKEAIYSRFREGLAPSSQDDNTRLDGEEGLGG